MLMVNQTSAAVLALAIIFFHINHINTSSVWGHSLMRPRKAPGWTQDSDRRRYKSLKDFEDTDGDMEAEAAVFPYTMCFRDYEWYADHYG
jgi:hypothetical protein